MLQKYLNNFFAVFLLSFSTTAWTEDYTFDPEADPAQHYGAALSSANEQGKLVLVVFGSEWCPDCRSLNQKMTQSPLGNTIEAGFVVTHVDIGNWDLNMAFAANFGEPVAKGIPSIAIVEADGKILYVSQAGEFASARSSGVDSLDEWFQAKLAEMPEL